MDDINRLKKAYLSLKSRDFNSALEHYRSLAKAGRCNPKTIDFFIELCKINLDSVGRSGSAEQHGFLTERRALFEEIKQIRESAIFDEHFYINSYGHQLASGVSAIEDFFDRGWRAKRDPNPLFSVSRYLRNEKSVDSSGNLINPLIDYLESRHDLVKARNAGIFDYFEYLNYPSTSLCFPGKVDFDSSGICSPSLKVLVVIHAYYLECLVKIFTSLKYIPCPFDLVVTVCSRSDEEAVKICLEEIGLIVGVIDIKVVPNHGRDLWPFVRVIKDLAVQGSTYDFVLKLHSKRSEARGKGKHYGEKWLDGILSNLLGSPENIKYILFQLLRGGDRCALVSPLTSQDVFRFCKWKNNLASVSHLLDRFDVQEDLDDPIYFPAGCMFWLDFNAALEISSCFEESRVPPEPLPGNGTYLHGFERLIPYILESTQKAMISHCNLDRSWVDIIDFRSLLSSEKFDEWILCFIDQMVSKMFESEDSHLRFPVYKNPSVSCVVVGDDLGKIMTTLVSLYFSRSLIDYQVVVFSPSLSSLQAKRLACFFPGIVCQRVLTGPDQAHCLLDFLPRSGSDRAMFLDAGVTISPVQFNQMLKSFERADGQSYSFCYQDRRDSSMQFSVLLSKMSVIVQCLEKSSQDMLSCSDFVGYLRQSCQFQLVPLNEF